MGASGYGVASAVLLGLLVGNVARATGPYDCAAWTELSELQHRWLPLSLIPAEERTDEQRALHARLDYRRRELTDALMATPLPSSQGVFASRTPWREGTDGAPLLRVLSPSVRERIVERLLRHHYVTDPQPYIDMILYRVNLTRQLRVTDGALVRVFTNDGIDTFERQLLLAEIVGQYHASSMNTVAPRPREYAAIRDGLRLTPAAALEAFRRQEIEGYPPENAAAGGAVYALEVVAMRRLQHDTARPLYDALVRLSELPVAQGATTLLDLLNVYLGIVDPTARVIDLQTAERFASGVL